MSAGIAQVRALLQGDFYEKLEKKTIAFADALNSYAQSKNYLFKVFSIGSIFWFAFTDLEHVRDANQIEAESMAYFKILHRELLEKSVYLGPSGYEVGFISAAHSEKDLEQAIAAICSSLDTVFAELPEGITKI